MDFPKEKQCKMAMAYINFIDEKYNQLTSIFDSFNGRELAKDENLRKLSPVHADLTLRLAMDGVWATLYRFLENNCPKEYEEYQNIIEKRLEKSELIKR